MLSAPFMTNVCFLNDCIGPAACCIRKVPTDCLSGLGVRSDYPGGGNRSQDVLESSRRSRWHNNTMSGLMSAVQPQCIQGRPR